MGSPSSLLEQMVSRTGHGCVYHGQQPPGPSQLQDARITRNTLCLPPQQTQPGGHQALPEPPGDWERGLPFSWEVGIIETTL